MFYLELVASAFGAFSVYLYIRRNHWSWPVGLVQVLLFIGVFWDAKLYADMLLHVIYAVLQVYGWWVWLAVTPSTSSPATIDSRDGTPERSDGTIRIQTLSFGGHIVSVATTILMTLLYAWLLIQYTDASLPIPDSMVAALSLVAQYLLAKRYLDNWLYWIVVDVLAIGLFAYKELYLTAGLYGLFLIMACIGYVVWRRALLDTEVQREELAIP